MLTQVNNITKIQEWANNQCASVSMLVAFTLESKQHSYAFISAAHAKVMRSHGYSIYTTDMRRAQHT